MHFAACFGSLLVSFGATMDRFESGAAATLQERALHVLSAVLQFPLLTLMRFIPTKIPGLLGYLLFFANSLIWGIAISLIISRIQNQLAQKRATSGPA